MSVGTENKQDVIERILRIKAQLRGSGVQRVALFGSFSRNAQNADSDVDLLVEFQPGRKTFDNYIAVCELLESSLQRRVEVLTPESLSPYIGPHILQEAEDVVVAD
jgi:predicted nucleotidyltransferase